MKRLIVYMFFLMTTLPLFAQKVALKNNLAYDALLTPNISLEFAMGQKVTLDTQIGANFFFYTTDASSPSYKTTKWSHWMVQPELRYWLCDAFNGWYMGLHAHGGELNIGGINIPHFVLQNKENAMKDHRYEGYFYGGGLSMGYQWVISDRFNIEVSLGVGYARVEYDKFECPDCGKLEETSHADYVGPTKASLSLIFLLK